MDEYNKINNSVFDYEIVNNIISNRGNIDIYNISNADRSTYEQIDLLSNIMKNKNKQYDNNRLIYQSNWKNLSPVEKQVDARISVEDGKSEDNSKRKFHTEADVLILNDDIYINTSTMYLTNLMYLRDFGISCSIQPKMDMLCTIGLIYNCTSVETKQEILQEHDVLASDNLQIRTIVVKSDDVEDEPFIIIRFTAIRYNNKVNNSDFFGQILGEIKKNPTLYKRILNECVTLYKYCDIYVPRSLDSYLKIGKIESAEGKNFMSISDENSGLIRWIIRDQIVNAQYINTNDINIIDRINNYLRTLSHVSKKIKVHTSSSTSGYTTAILSYFVDLMKNIDSYTNETDDSTLNDENDNKNTFRHHDIIPNIEYIVKNILVK